VDWAEHPAAGVFAHSTGNDGRQLLMVRRAGCGLDDYGTVDARQVKRARIEGEDFEQQPYTQTIGKPGGL
jgi:hypothetical protein